MAEDPFKAMNLSRREYLSKFGQSVIDSPNSNISDREDALVVKEGLSNQRGREAQQQFYDVAPNAREAFLEDNAVISASPQFGQVQGYMGEVRRAGPTYADNVLRKSIASKVPAYLRGEYNARVDAGEGVNEVFADLEIKNEDRNLRLKGIEAGIAPADMDRFRNPETGLHDAEAVKHEIANRSKKTASRASPQMDAMKEEYEFLRQSVKDMKEEYGGLAPPTGENPEYDAAVLQMRGLGARMSAARSSVFNPPVKEKIDTTADWAAADAAEVGLQGAAAPVVAAPAPITPSIEQELSRVPVTEQAAWLENRRKQEADLQEAAKEWTKAKDDLEKELLKNFPDVPYAGTNTRPIEQLALQIVNGAQVYDDEGMPNIESGELPKITVADKVLRSLDVYTNKKAFTEPGSKRKRLFGLLGSQDVGYGELLRGWADNFLKQRGVIQTKVQDNVNMPPEEIEKAVNFLNKKVPVQ